MLRTNVRQVTTAEEISRIITENPYVMICCGRMGPMCIPVYEIMHRLEPGYPHVVFRCMDFDLPDADIIKTLPECSRFMGLPFTVYYKTGKVAHATTSIQTPDQITDILDNEFSGGRNGNR